jgi:hypothetical protein
MKEKISFLISTLFLAFGGAFVTPIHAQVLDIPKPPTQEQDSSLSVLKTEYSKLTTLIPRLENTLVLITKRGFDTEKAQLLLDETKEQFVQTKELFEKKNVKKDTIEESMKDSRLLLSQTLREIRLSLIPKEN